MKCKCNDLNVQLDTEIKMVHHKHFHLGHAQTKQRLHNPAVPAAYLTRDIIIYSRACLQSAEYADM
jgi:hypothetical protein